MKNIIKIMLALCAVCLVSCTIPVPGGQMILGNGGPVGQGGYGAQGAPTQQLVDNGGTYHKSVWHDGENRYTYTPGATVSTYNHALTPAEKFKLADQLDAWAIGLVKAKQPKPTNEQATEEARRIVGHDKVRVIMGNNFSQEFISQERRLVSRETINESEVPQDAKDRLRSKAEESFYRNQTNEPVEDSVIYPQTNEESQSDEAEGVLKAHVGPQGIHSA
jgi:hypothetical protein